jgi:hypothetical protein
VSNGQTVYCIDSSSLIACRRLYPIERFPGLWGKLDDLATNGLLIAPEEVWFEINQGSDSMTTWAAQWEAELKIAAGHDEFKMMQTIATDFPQANYTTITEHRADPWVVAHAHTRGCCVVSEEGGTSDAVPKIPQMCAHYGIPHKKILKVMEAEQWTFY